MFVRHVDYMSANNLDFSQIVSTTIHILFSHYQTYLLFHITYIVPLVFGVNRINVSTNLHNFPTFHIIVQYSGRLESEIAYLRYGMSHAVCV